ncbi:MAG TPA: GntR family transcriptional regulator [Noviherbaspirillum sp.]|uniref:GntR family transcriptional regulator n=1 Tax=Noviherbaspirillum sp. TaxID=1926288 RepID=UPI002D5F1196|nr:GntR family transcriptional regulator [Noviherbaspirillum sp.]HYD94954.1 GntR family transcriptional regulator [Noviherbaspirillum sp.]
MKPIAARIVEIIQSENLAVGTHLPAQMLADRLRVSRQPVNDALGRLCEEGILSREPNRGYFLARVPLQPLPALQENDLVTAAYFRIAEERLSGKLPDAFTESMLRQRYRLTATQLSAVLGRIAQEGWAEKKPGYGWAFSSMLTSAESLVQSYRLRLAVEPAALLEPGYRLDRLAIERCKAAELHLLEGGIDTDTPDQLHDRGVRFHETLVGGSGNPFFIDTIRRVNRVRRLLSYRSTLDRSRYKQHCKQHLHILELLQKERNEEASEAVAEHLRSTVKNITKIRKLLDKA